MSQFDCWIKEPGLRLQGSRDLDCDKLLAPCITRDLSGLFRLFYTGVGPAKPFAKCHGYILSAVSEDGLNFRVEEGIRIAPRLELPYACRRALAPNVICCGDGSWRMYFGAAGLAGEPAVICSALSDDMLNWHWEDGVRLRAFDGVGGARYLPLAEGRGRLYCWAREGQGNILACAASSDGINFEIEPECRFDRERTEFDSLGITAAEVIAPTESGGDYAMIYSEWQNVPPGTQPPVHPSNDTDSDVNDCGSGNSGNSDSDEDFAVASIASDISGYRSRIYTANSSDGILWQRRSCIIEGAGYAQPGADAVHAEDMSLIRLDDGRYRMYYAACDTNGRWSVASAVTKV